ncbi:hypothetical protein FHQ26_06900 [Testudinibacter sp. TR-2022]|uniref:hypothetical protein n=1 Tax=Testudinibacter sp. TR-2022 TaxID=2585029 RepID=UPI001119BF17|nr:hypothetical protein [Testudinibacter sp. TR-2022]TNH04967.1 hypothetical protein FHQ22_02480 [Pasteurellaceae bacterium Phil31]TNH09318.1 hypothetical protein FHQ25_07985 [Testudinibacter sp. TR-2022]TNH09628.1 hypothetical protein FHQ26_06900 [Testudinibacter sp. TR-2022]TNH13477.1 hypothetical protein FIA56_07140 [Testudinibacter sp. TR-2022]TNH19153.1 hypothetical protein FHQ23_04165 [Testudinibacter sp. TR-2022]
MFFLYQLHQLQDRFKTWLPQVLPGLQIADARFAYFPSPTLALSQLDYQAPGWNFSAQQAIARFSWFSLFSLSPQIKQIELYGGTIAPLNLNIVSLSLDNIDQHYNLAELSLTAASVENNRLHLTALAQRFANGVALHQLQLNGEMVHGYFLNNRNIALSAEKLSLSQQQNLWQMVLQQGLLNQLPLESAVLHYTPDNISDNNDPKPHFTLQLQQDSGILEVNGQQRAQGNFLALQGKQLSLSPLLAFLQLPVVLSGISDFSGNVWFSDGVLTNGDLTLNISQAELNGLNLLGLISQYFPIRQGAKKYADRIVTPFDQVSAALSWNQQILSLNKLSAQGKDLHLSGSGEMNLTDFNCRFELRLSPNIVGYSQYQLPVRLFGPCRSPQYQVKVDKRLENQLKDLLREKLRERSE